MGPRGSFMVFHGFVEGYVVSSWPHDPARPCRLWPNDDDDVEEEEDVSLFLCTITYNVES